MWFIDTFGEPILNLLLGVGGLVICILAIIIVVIVGGLIYLLLRLALYKVRLASEPYWHKSARLKKELKAEGADKGTQ